MLLISSACPLPADSGAFMPLISAYCPLPADSGALMPLISSACPLPADSGSDLACIFGPGETALCPSFPLLPFGENLSDLYL
jgi:hypothetical protein